MTSHSVRRTMRLLVAIVGVTAASCVLPTDRGGSVRAEFPVQQVFLVVGDTVRVAATSVSEGGVVVHLPLTYTSVDEDIAVVSPEGVVLGVGEGETKVVAALRTYAAGRTDTLDVIVSRGIVVRTITGEVSGAGTRVFFGETIELAGRRLMPESLTVVTIGAVPAAVVGYDPADPGDPVSLERLRLRVPVVPPTSELLLVHRDGGTASRALSVTQRDVLDAGGPAVIDLSHGDYVNDALTATSSDPDLFRVILPAGPHTLTLTILDGRLLRDGDPELRFLAPQPSTYSGIFEGYYVSSDIPDVWGWSVENRGLSCDLRTAVYYLTGFFNEPRGPGNAVTLALANSTPDTVDVMAATVDRQIRYRLEARAGYWADLPPDALEENDACVDATEVTPTGAPVDLSFDNVTDFDWFAVTLGAGAPAPSFTVNAEVEREPNDAMATAQLVSLGSRVTAMRDTEDDLDVFAVDLEAGTLLDVDARARLAADVYRKYDCPERCEGGEAVPWAPLGATLITDVVVQVRVFDAAGTLVARDTVSPFVRDARVRYLVPSSGRYYVEVEPFGGEELAGQGSGNPIGVEQYYAIDVFAHDAPSELRVDVESLDGSGDPQIVVLERRPDKNAVLDVSKVGGAVERYARTMHPGSYLILVYEDAGVPGPYRLRIEEVAVPTPVGPVVP